MPELRGVPVGRARDKLEDMGMRVSVLEVVSDQPAGTVVMQTPPAGYGLEKGQRVALQVGQVTEAQPAAVSSRPSPRPPSASSSSQRWPVFFLLQGVALMLGLALWRGRGKS